MAYQTLRSRNLVRLLAVSLVLAMLATVGLVALPAGRAAFNPPGLAVANSKYWGGHTFVPGEVMTITVYADPGDSVNVTVQDTSGTPTATIGIIMPAVGVRFVNYTLRPEWPDGTTYQVLAHDATSGTNAGPIGFSIRQYNWALYTDRRAYLPGDSVTLNWVVVYEQNYSAAPAGKGAFQAHDTSGANLLPTPQVNFTASQSSSSFTIGTSQAVPEFVTVEFWFNDTAALRAVHAFTSFRIGTLGITITGISGTPYHPKDLVTATIRTTVVGIPGAPYPEPAVPVVVNVTDLATSTVVAGYSATGLTTDHTGMLTYAFVLAATPTTGNYEFAGTATAHGVQSAQASIGFTVEPLSVLSVTISLDKLQYRSGDVVHAKASVISTESLPVTYGWIVVNTQTGATLASSYGNTAPTYDYTIPGDLQIQAPYWLLVEVIVNDGNGTLAFAIGEARVAYGYLNVNLNKLEYNAGDTLTVTYSLSSNVMTNPTYVLEITDSLGVTLQSGPTSGGSATFTVPSPAADFYDFTVVASQGGMSVEGLAEAAIYSGYYISLTPDKTNYVPGDTVTVGYAVTTLGTSALPTKFEFFVSLEGLAYQFVTATSPTGSLTLTIPANAPTGNVLLSVAELNTMSSQTVVIHVGAINPLVADIGGVPLFDILISLLFVVLLLAVILLWRRAGMGKGPAPMEPGKPAATPPPPPSGPSQQAAGPMSVACKHCGASIEITTSKRPIEVMCPSCGETQVVQ